MAHKVARFLLSVCLIVGLTGCALKTEGGGSWEIYGGVRIKQHSENPAKISLESSIVDKIVDSFTDGKVTKDE